MSDGIQRGHGLRDHGLRQVAGDDAVFTAYEGLRDGTATRLLIHTTDAGGTSRPASVDAVPASERAIEVACGPFGAPAP